MSRPACKHCGKLLVEAGGPMKAPLLLVAEFPGLDEIKTGVPWSGKAGEVLKKELGRAGIQYNTCRSTNLWMHQMDPKGCKMSWHIEQLMGEMQDRQGVLLMGSEVSKFLLGESISDITGLRVKSKNFPKSVKVAVAMYNPAFALRDKVGEVRLAIERFAEWTEDFR